MPTDDRDFYDAPRFTPEPFEPPREHGCFFYGCIIASVVAVLFVTAVALLLYFAYRGLGQLVEQYTATIPRELPAVEMRADQRETLRERVDSFRRAIEGGTPTGPLVLTGDDLNALIEDNPDLKGRIYVTIEGDKLKGQVSIPLEFLGLPVFRGRYLNGQAELKASLREGLLLVTLESFEINGKRPPEQFLAQMRQKNMAEDAYKDPKNAEQIRKLESIEVKDGKIIITARGKEAGTRPGASDRLKDLPDDVLAPPDTDRLKAEPARFAEWNGSAPQAEEPAKKP